MLCVFNAKNTKMEIGEGIVQRYKIVNDLLEGRRGRAFLMFVVMLLAALAESLGLSLILPLLPN